MFILILKERYKGRSKILEPQEVEPTVNSIIDENRELQNDIVEKRSTNPTASKNSPDRTLTGNNNCAQNWTESNVAQEDAAHVNTSQNIHGITDQINEEVGGIINQQNQFIETQRAT